VLAATVLGDSVAGGAVLAGAVLGRAVVGGAVLAATGLLISGGLARAESVAEDEHPAPSSTKVVKAATRFGQQRRC